MLKNKLTIGIAIVALVVAGVAVYVFSDNSPKDLDRIATSLELISSEEQFGGNSVYQRKSFLEGFWAGTGRQLTVDRSGNLTTSGTVISTSASDATFSGGLTVDTPTFVVDATNNKVGMGTTSPTALLTVGSTTPSSLTAGNQYKSAYINGELEVDGASWFDGAMTLASTLTVAGNLAVDTNILLVDITNDRVGVGSTTPSTDLAIGTGLSTSTISGGNFCAYFEDQAGRGMWLTLAISGNVVFATSTTACN